MKILSIQGNTQRLDGGAMFGNAPKELWKQWIPADEKNRVHLACRALLYQTDAGKNHLFEAGIGSFFDPKMRERYGVESEHLLLKNLASHGLREEDIDAVILSHLHFDHAGGLLSPYDEGEPRLLFPKATYYLGKEHWKRAQSPHLRERASFIPHLHPLLEKSGRLVLIEGSEHPDLGNEISFRYSNGHTIGLLLAQIELEERKIIFASDLVPGIPWIHLPVVMGYDRFPELLIDEKKKLFEEISNENSLLFLTHDPKTEWVTISQEVSGKYIGHPI